MSKSRIEALVLWIAVTGAFLFCVSLWYGETYFRYNAINYIELKSENGVWDASDIDFSNSIVYLHGNVAHIEGEMLLPHQFNDSEAVISDPIDFNQGRTAKLLVNMPEDGYYRIHVIGDYARSLYVNGSYRGSFGTPAADAESFEPAYGEISVDAKADDNHFSIVLQGGNFTHREGSSYSNVIIGNTKLVTWFIGFQSSLEILSMALLLVLFVTHILMALVFRSRPLNFCFSLLCLIYGVRLGLVGSKAIYDFFPSFPWDIAIRIEYLTIVLGAILILVIMRIHFKAMINKHVNNIFHGIFIVFAICYLFIDTITLSNTLIPLTATYTICIVYVTICLIIGFIQMANAKKKIIIPQVIAALSVIVLFYTAINDAMFFTNAGYFRISNSLAEIGIMIFSIFQAIAIFHSTMKTAEIARTAEREALAQAKLYEKLNRLKTIFLQDISHEMKTPLTVISTGVDYAMIAGDPTDESKEALLIVREEAARLARMISAMVDMASTVMGENRKRLNLATLLHKGLASINIIVKGTNTVLAHKIPNSLPHVYVDADNFMHVITNILSNAVRHTPQGEISVVATYDSQFITVTIRDTGEGIAEDLLPDVTKRGVSGHGGMGIGLYLSKMVVDSHGGNLSIESVQNEGTVVTFTVPIYGGQEEGHRI